MHAVYIHIPFCKNICSYCDFCKLFYNEKLVDQYLEQLEKEISKYSNVWYWDGQVDENYRVGKSTLKIFYQDFEV